MNPAVVLALAVSSALDFLVALFALYCPVPWRPRDRRVGLSRVFVAAFLAAGSLLVKTVLLVPLGLNPFGFIHLVYLELFVVVPAVGVVLLLGHSSVGWFGRGREATGLARLVAILALVLPAVGFHSTWIHPYQLRLETAEVALAPERAGSAEVRIGVIADLQTRRVTAYEENAIRRLLDEKPDIVLIPGDVYQGPSEELDERFPGFRALLDELRPPGGTFIVQGNTDLRDFFERLAAECPHVRILRNEIVETTVRDRRVTIAGTSLGWRGERARGAAAALETAPGDEDVRILLTHQPDAVANLSPDTRVDLVVAGHTHGGQVVLPFIGPPITLSSVPRRIAAGGLGEMDGRRIYVSRGVGMERGQAPRLRFLCPPEVSLLTLR